MLEDTPNRNQQREETTTAAAAPKTLQVKGTTIQYHELGQGVPIVLSHPNISDMRSWEPIQNRLAERFRVIIYSRRYHHPNPPIPDDQGYSWEAQVEDLEALIVELEIAPVHAVGSSAGAVQILLLACRRPDLFRSIILEEAIIPSVYLPKLPPTAADFLKVLVSRPLACLPLTQFWYGVMQPTTAAFKEGDSHRALQIFGRRVFGKTFFEKITNERYKQMLDNVGPHRAMFLYSEWPHFTNDHARDMRVPTLLLTGKQSARFFSVIGQRTAELIPNAQHHVIPNASHFVHEDNPTAVVEEIFSFTKNNE